MRDARRPSSIDAHTHTARTAREVGSHRSPFRRRSARRACDLPTRPFAPTRSRSALRSRACSGRRVVIWIARAPKSWIARSRRCAGGRRPSPLPSRLDIVDVMPPSAHTDISPLSQLMMHVDAVADGTASADSIPTGFPSLDKLLGGGLRRGDLVVLGGDVGVGKSALALAIALRARSAGTAVEFMSGEMDLTRVLERVLAIEGKASVDQIRQGTL